MVDTSPPAGAENLNRSQMSVPTWLLTLTLVLALLLIASNCALLMKNQGLRNQLRNLIADRFAPPGAPFPVLKGVRPSGKIVDIDLVGSAPLVLLLFDPDCAICEQNWGNWEKLLTDSAVGKQVIFVSAALEVSPDYLGRHPSIRGDSVIGLSPDLVRSLNLVSTPQTILENRGTIISTWPGILSADAVAEVKHELLKLNARE